MDKFQEKLKELRIKHGWVQEDVAREIGVSLSTVQRWERQGGKPSRLARRELRKLFEEAQIEWDDNPSKQ
jgi:transcriptional regulator with XRE-family HTH domain